MSVAIMTASRRSMRPFVIALSTPRHEILAFIDGTRKALGKADGVCRIVKRARRQAASGARAGRWMPNGLCASGANVAYNTSRETVPPCKLIGSGPEPSRCGEDGSHVRSAGENRAPHRRRQSLCLKGARLRHRLWQAAPGFSTRAYLLRAITIPPWWRNRKRPEGRAATPRIRTTRSCLGG